ncbi:MAG: esterase-like activity of phytase family protein [Patulibacter sp.]
MYRTTLTALTGAALAMFAVAASADAAALQAPTLAGRYALDRSLILPTPTLTDASPIIAAGGIREGGLSALEVVPGTGNRRFVTITDRGPNGQPTAATDGRTFPSPGFAPTIMELSADADGRLSVLRRTQIRVPGSDPVRGSGTDLIAGDRSLITGLRNVVTAKVDDRIWLMQGDTQLSEYLPTDPYGLDTEGIAVDPRDGSYWVSDEYRPSIARLSPSGVMAQRIVPVDAGDQDTDPTSATKPLSDYYDGADQPALQELLPKEWNARKLNRGLEGLTISADGRTLYGILQNPLDTRNADYTALGYGTRCDGVSGAASQSQNFYRGDRVVRFDITDPQQPVLTGEFIYQLKHVSSTDSSLQGKQRVSDLTWVGDDRLLVDEHDDDADGHANRALYELDLADATNLTDAYPTYASRQEPVTIGGVTQPAGCFIDQGQDAELAALPTPITPGAKSLYLDLSPAGVDFAFNKVEGVAKLDGIDGVAIINDNDFGFEQDNTTNLISPAADPASELRIYATAPSRVTPPSISGTAQAGHTLTCDPGTTSGSGTVSNAYTWLRGTTEIAGADTSRLTLSAEEIGSPITCRVTATHTAGAVVAAAPAQESAATVAVAGVDAGPAGPAGESGATGAKGENGPTGAKGETGATGAKGADGIVRLPKVSCKLKRRVIRCTVKAPDAASRVVVKSAAGRTLARRSVANGTVITLQVARTPTLRIVALRGATAVAITTLRVR